MKLMFTFVYFVIIVINIDVYSIYIPNINGEYDENKGVKTRL